MSSEANLVRRKHAVLALKLLAGLLLIAAPVYIGEVFVTGLFSVAFFGVLAASFGWLAGGPKVASGVVISIAVLGVVAVLLHGHTWILAALLVGLGVLYGYAASRGVGKAALQLPILTPYFIMAPPPLFASPPIIDATYIGAFLVIVIAAGAWTMFVLHFAAPASKIQHVDVPDRRIPILYGTVLGIISAFVMVAASASGLKSHWAWLTLTIYVLADPVQLLTWKRMFGRVLGTFAGFGAVTVLLLIGIPEEVLQNFAPLTLWVCVYFMAVKRPYWQYTLFLTASVVLMNSKGMSTLLLNTERAGFTAAGAILSVLAAYLVKFIFRIFHQRALTIPVVEGSN